MRQVCLAIFLVLGSFELSLADVISIEGKGLVSEQPDQFQIEVEIEISSGNSNDGWKMLRSSIEDLYERVRQEGVEREQFSVRLLGLEEKQQRFDANAWVTVTVPVGPGNEELLDAIQRGGVARVVDFGYGHSKASALRDQARVMAVDDAMKQLAKLAESSGGKIGKVLSIGDLGRQRDSAAYMREPEGTVERRAVPLSIGVMRFNEKIRVEAEFIRDE